MLFASGSEREQANSFILAWVYQLFKSQRLEKRSFQRQNAGGGTQQSLIRGGSTPRSSPLFFDIPFLTRKVPLSSTLYIDER